MFSIFKKNKDQGVPAWASFFTVKEYVAFIDAVEYCLKQKKLIYALREGIVDFEEDDILNIGQMGLSNIAQSCKQNKRSEYKKIVLDHFDAMLRNFEFEAELNKIISDFDQVKSFLGFRVYHNHYIDHIGREKVIGIPVSEHLLGVLVLDLPQSIINVQLEHIKSWNLSKEELIQIGKNNVRTKYELPILKEAILNTPLYVVTVNHFFSSNIYFDLDNYPELLGKYGSIVSFPHRHTTLICPIQDISVVKILAHFVNITYGMNTEGPGSIGKEVYWLNNGELVDIVYDFENNNVSITPPEEFVELLNALSVD